MVKAGFYTTDISVPIGYNMSGFIRGLTTRAFGSLKIRAAVFSDGNIKTALVGVDTCCLEEDIVLDALAEVKRLANLTFDAHIIAATHVHTSGHVRYGWKKQAQASKEILPPEIYALMDPESLPVPDEAYYHFCKSQLATAIIEAYYRLEDAEISYGKGFDAARVFNRRIKMKNGRTYTHPGKGNPDMVDYAGPIDPEVNVLGAWRKDGSLIGCVINFACHGTCMCGANGSHGDWYHYTDKVIKKLMGEDVNAVIFNGASGDVTQVDNFSPRPDFGERVAKELGGRIGAEAYKVLLGAYPRSDVKMAVAHDVMDISKRRPSAAHFEEAVEKLKVSDPETDDEATFARTTVLTEVMYRLNPVSKQDITVIKIGEGVFVSNQNELFTELGMKIKKGSSFPYTFVCCLANGVSVYVPTLSAFDMATGGGYETRINPGRLDIHAGDMMADRAVELINTLAPDEPEKVDCPPRKPWSYGTNPPQID